MSRIGGVFRRIGAGIGLGAAIALSLALPAGAAESAGTAAAAPGIVRADVEDFTFSSVHVDYLLSRDDEGVGTATVTETFVAEFPPAQNRGMVRGIPTGYLGAPTNPEVISVTDEDGDPRPYETDTEDGLLRVTSAVPEGEYAERSQTYVFTYRVDNVARAMDNGVDEFFWDVFTTDAPQPVGSFTARIEVDPELADALTGDAACYVGGAGGEDRCDMPQAGAAFETAPVALDSHEGVTVAIGFEPGTFTNFDASFLASPWGWAQSAAAVGAVGTAAWAGVVRRRRLRDDPGRPTIIAEYEPPAGVDALTAAVLLGKSGRAIPAEILEQAVGGSLRIVEERGLLRPKLAAELVDPGRPDENGLRVLKGLFGKDLPIGKTFTFGKSSSRFARAAQKLIERTGAQITREWKRRVPTRVVLVPAVLGLILGGATFAFGIVAMIQFVTWFPTVPLIALGFALIFVTIILVTRRPLNATGAEVRDHLRGLEEFIGWAEEDRIRMLQSPEGAERAPVDTTSPQQMLVLYERLLPFAVVFGQEKDWAERLAVMYGSDSPAWWAGSGAFNAAAFSSGLGTLTASAASSSTASSSGGSTGGGSVGGGGGGGSVGGV